MVPAKAKKVIKVILIILLAAVLIVGGYVAYVMIDYHRIEDNQALQINDATSDAALVDTEYKVISYNIASRHIRPISASLWTAVHKAVLNRRSRSKM